MYAPQLAKYARPAAQKGCASYAQGLTPPFCASVQIFQHSFFVDPFVIDEVAEL